MPDIAGSTLPIKRIYAEMWLLKPHLNLQLSKAKSLFDVLNQLLFSVKLLVKFRDVSVHAPLYILSCETSLPVFVGSRVSESLSAHPGLQCTDCTLPPSLLPSHLPFLPSLPPSFLPSMPCFLFFPSPHYPPCGLCSRCTDKSCLQTLFRVCFSLSRQQPDGFFTTHCGS